MAKSLKTKSISSKDDSANITLTEEQKGTGKALSHTGKPPKQRNRLSAKMHHQIINRRLSSSEVSSSNPDTIEETSDHSHHDEMNSDMKMIDEV